MNNQPDTGSFFEGVKMLEKKKVFHSVPVNISKNHLSSHDQITN